MVLVWWTGRFGSLLGNIRTCVPVFLWVSVKAAVPWAPPCKDRDTVDLAEAASCLFFYCLRNFLQGLHVYSTLIVFVALFLLEGL